MWIPQKRLVSHSNKWVSSQIKSTCSVTIKVVNKCLLYIRRISLTRKKGLFDLFPTCYKPFAFSLINTKTSKRFCLIMFRKTTTKKGVCVLSFSCPVGGEMKLVWFCLLKNTNFFLKHWNSCAKISLQVFSRAIYWCH